MQKNATAKCALTYKHETNEKTFGFVVCVFVFVWYVANVYESKSRRK